MSNSADTRGETILFGFPLNEEGPPKLLTLGFKSVLIDDTGTGPQLLMFVTDTLFVTINDFGVELASLAGFDISIIFDLMIF